MLRAFLTFVLNGRCRVGCRPFIKQSRLAANLKIQIALFALCVPLSFSPAGEPNEIHAPVTDTPSNSTRGIVSGGNSVRREATQSRIASSERTMMSMGICTSVFGTR